MYCNYLEVCSTIVFHPFQTDLVMRVESASLFRPNGAPSTLWLRAIDIRELQLLFHREGEELFALRAISQAAFDLLRRISIENNYPSEQSTHSFSIKAMVDQLDNTGITESFEEFMGKL